MVFLPSIRAVITTVLMFVRSIALLFMIFKSDRSTNACNNLTMSRLTRHNFDCDLRQFFYCSIQKLHQTLESSWFAPTIAFRTLKNIGSDILIVWIWLQLHDSPFDQSRPLIIFINPLFFLWLGSAVCCPSNNKSIRFLSCELHSHE